MTIGRPSFRSCRRCFDEEGGSSWLALFAASRLSIWADDVWIFPTIANQDACAASEAAPARHLSFEDSGTVCTGIHSHVLVSPHHISLQHIV